MDSGTEEALERSNASRVEHSCVLEDDIVEFVVATVTHTPTPTLVATYVQFTPPLFSETAHSTPLASVGLVTMPPIPTFYHIHMPVSMSPIVTTMVVPTVV